MPETLLAWHKTDTLIVELMNNNSVVFCFFFLLGAWMLLMSLCFCKISHISLICRHYFYNRKSKISVMNFVAKYFVFS